jgi:hypothetical protein
MRKLKCNAGAPCANCERDGETCSRRTVSEDGKAVLHDICPLADCNKGFQQWLLRKHIREVHGLLTVRGEVYREQQDARIEEQKEERAVALHEELTPHHSDAKNVAK